LRGYPGNPDAGVNPGGPDAKTTTGPKHGDICVSPSFDCGSGNNLICVVDYNKIQSFGRVDAVLALEPFADKWRAFGWHVQEIDGAAVIGEDFLADFELDLGRIVVAFRNIVHGKRPELGFRRFFLHGGEQIRRKRRNSAPARDIRSNDSNTRRSIQNSLLRHDGGPSPTPTNAAGSSSSLPGVAPHKPRRCG
jgi:hypothetical protein